MIENLSRHGHPHSTSPDGGARRPLHGRFVTAEWMPASTSSRLAGRRRGARRVRRAGRFREVAPLARYDSGSRRYGRTGTTREARAVRIKTLTRRPIPGKVDAGTDQPVEPVRGDEATAPAADLDLVVSAPPWQNPGRQSTGLQPAVIVAFVSWRPPATGREDLGNLAAEQEPPEIRWCTANSLDPAAEVRRRRHLARLCSRSLRSRS
jgi:hypothetical protein